MGTKKSFVAKGVVSDQNQVTDQTGGYRPSQPSQRFPFYPMTPPRMDNINQPWYGSADRTWGRGPGTDQTNDIVTQKSDGATRPLVKSFWEVLNGFFGGNTAKDNLMDTSNVYSPDDEVVDPASVGASNNQFMKYQNYGTRGSYGY